MADEKGVERVVWKIWHVGVAILGLIMFNGIANWVLFSYIFLIPVTIGSFLQFLSLLYVEAKKNNVMVCYVDGEKLEYKELHTLNFIENRTPDFASKHNLRLTAKYSMGKFIFGWPRSTNGFSIIISILLFYECFHKGHPLCDFFCKDNYNNLLAELI